MVMLQADLLLTHWGTMFMVLTTSPLDDTWEERDLTIYNIAGRKSDYNSAYASSANKGINTREHGWVVEDFKTALQLKNLLNSIQKVNATLREK